MIEQFGLWTYNDGWQVLLLVCVMLVAAGILMGILWNTKGLADELSGRKRQRELEYLRHRFAEMNVRSLDEVNVADPLSHVGESAPMPLTPAGGVFTPQAAQPLGAGEVLNVGGVEVSQQQVAAIKSELLGDDDEPVTGFFTDGGKDTGESEKAEGEVKKGEKAEVEEPKTAEAKVEEPKTAEDKVEEPKTTEAKVEETKTAEDKVEEPKTTPAPVSSNIPTSVIQQGIQPVSPAAQGIQPVESAIKAPAEGAAKAPADDAVKVSSAAFTNPALLRIQANAEKAFGSEENEESEQSTGILTPAEDDASDATPTGIFTPVKEDKKPAESADSDSSEGITAHLAPESADDDEGVTTTFAPAGSSSAYHMKGAQFMGELISTGSYDPKTGETKLESPSGVDKATTGFLND